MAWLPKRCVVVPVDFSANSWSAVEHALELVAQPSHLQLIHVLPVLEPADPGVIWNTVDDESRRHHAEQAIRAHLADARYQGIACTIEFGDPGRQIAEFAQRLAADLIVMPSHGRTGLQHLLIGSVAERVVRLAHCPVLVLKR
jgi:nucleotide-binding universal stress UspA family protein